MTSALVRSASMPRFRVPALLVALVLAACGAKDETVAAATSVAEEAARTEPQASQAQPATPPARPAQPAKQVQTTNKPVPGPIVADPPHVDFGVVAPGTVVSANIKLFNPLDTPVTIKAAKPTCTCTTVDMAGKVIPPKGSIDMPMSMKTSNSVGERAAELIVVFEGMPQQMVLRLDAETAYAVRANPAYVDALAPERMKGAVELLAVDGKPFKVLTVDGKPAATADGSPMTAATRQVVRYDFTTEPAKPVPPFLIVATDHPDCPVMDLRVRHETTRITPSLAFEEFRSNVGIIPAKGSIEFEIQIKMMGQNRVQAAVSLNPAAKAEVVSQTSDGQNLLVKLRLTDQGLPKGTFLFPCRFASGSKSADLWIYGLVR
jgi:hypothetical protein